VPATSSTIPLIVILAARSVGSPSSDKLEYDALSRAAEERVLGLLNPPGTASPVTSGLFAGSRIYGNPVATPAASPAAAQVTVATGTDRPVAAALPLIVGTFVLRYSAGRGARGAQPERPATRGAQPAKSTQLSDSVVGIISLVVEGKTCYLRAADVRWQVPGLWQEQLPEREGGFSLPAAPLNVLRSPVRLVVRTVGSGSDSSGFGREFERAVDRARIVHEAAAAQRADTLPFPVRSEAMAAACAHFYGDKEPVAKAGEPLRVHRDVTMTYQGNVQNVPPVTQPGVVPGTPQNIFPATAPRCGLQSSPFGSPLKSLAPDNASNPQAAGAWSAQACIDFAVAQSARFTEELQSPSFEIVSRNGRWVTLAGGRTAGLVVGSRLVSANGAKLHVIRIVGPALPDAEKQSAEAPRQGDQAIAYVRSENPSSPLVKGNQVSLDPQVYSAPKPPSK
jgi:hypothetical protein